ncbi:MAG: hypothetical protein J0H74_28480 [Chitinophagaceae bacterium]|nr:hypothetical protein [Chitinophagaceae bacterium]
MEKAINTIILLSIGVLTLLSCKKDTTAVPLNLQKPAISTEGYLANLRAYKKTKHQVAFGWFGNSGGDGKSPSMQARWESIPDSVDIVSMWGGIPTPGSPQMAAMKYAQQVKGTKAVMVTFSNDGFLTTYGGKDFLNKYAGGGDSLLSVGFALVAKSVADTLDKYGLDGIDLDHEPHYCGCNWGILSNSGTYSLLIKALAQYMGPLSGTGKLLLVDGEPDQVNTGAVAGLSYGVAQAYGTSSPSSLQSRLDGMASGFPSDRYIVAENFEDYWKTGGVSYNDPVHGTIPSLLGMAYWNPIQGAKGGAGAYHAEYEYSSPVPYNYLRQMIQIMNPAAK